MAADLDTFKTCVKGRANLDLEAMDVMWVQPIQDLCKWWDRQSDQTKRFMNFFTLGLGGASLTAFLVRVLKTTVATVGTAVLEALGAALVGIALALAITAFVECSIFDVPQA